MNEMPIVGSDFEFPIVGQQFALPASLFIKGTKDDPIYLDTGAKCHWDNGFVEIATTPHIRVDEFYSEVSRSVQEVRRDFIPPELRVDWRPASRFPALYTQRPDLQELGCKPDINAWTGEENPRPMLEHMGDWRASGTHYHCSFDRTEQEKFNLIKLLDTFVEAPKLNGRFVRMRRDLYGKAGSCRLKDYGVEWRVPCTMPPMTMARTFMKVQLVVKHYDSLWDKYGKYISTERVSRAIIERINQNLRLTHFPMGNILRMWKDNQKELDQQYNLIYDGEGHIRDYLRWDNEI